MSSLPANWSKAPIAEISAAPEQRVPDNSETFRYIDIASIDRDRKVIGDAQELTGANAPSRARKVVRAGDVLVSMTRPNLNAVAMVPDDLDGQIASTGFDVLRPKGVDPRWLYYLVRTQAFVEGMSALVQGALYPAVRSKDIRAFLAPVAPLKEQKRIADKVEGLLKRVTACRERLDRVPELLKRFRQSVLAAAVSGELTAQWRSQQLLQGTAEDEVRARELGRQYQLKVRGGRRKLGSDQLYELPSSWAWIDNNRLARDEPNAICAGPFGTIFKARDFRPAGVPIIFLRHVTEKGYSSAKPGFMDEAVWRKFHQEYTVHGGELLVTKLGDPPGTACIYPDGIGPAMVTPDVLKMSVDEHVANSKYLMYFFNSPASKKIVKDMAFGMTRLRIDIAMFKQFPIPTPCLDEQNEIVRRVETLFMAAEQIESAVMIARERVVRLTSAVLAKAFRGQLVPSDPNDEPADRLIARVQMERKETRGKPAATIQNTYAKQSTGGSTVVMKRSEVSGTYLSELLNKLGPATPETLWRESKLEVEDFFDLLREEEAAQRVREIRPQSISGDILLEKV